MADDFLINSKAVQRLGGFSASHWYDIQNTRSPRFDPTAPKRVRISGRMVRYWHNEVLAWLKRNDEHCGKD